jgi:CzcA family heavy metal efflux pump
MTLLRFAIRHAHAVVFLIALLVAAGLISGLALPSGIYPPLQFPRAVIIARSGTLPTRTMVLDVTRPLEQAAMEVPGVRRVRSRTFRGSTEISAQFEPSMDMIVAVQQLQNRVAEIRSSLPADADITIERLTPATFPILSLNVTGALPVADLRDYAFYVMRPSLARVPGVGRVDVAASDTREIEVVVEPSKLLSAGLSVVDVSNALKSTNVLEPVARYPDAGRQHLALASGLWTSIDDIARTPIAVRKTAATRIGDVAQVFPGAPDRTTLVTGNGQDAAVINISQQVDSNILQVKAGVESALTDLARALPSGLKVSKVYDLADFVSTAMTNVRDAILIGGFLAIVILALFLRDWRLTLTASLTLPLTAIATLFFLRLFGESINLMSMGGLAVAIGLVIDDAVVVVENIHRRLMRGGGPEEVEKATSELIAPVVASTLTTVVVFAPLSLLSGVVGQFFRALSLTLSVAVLISLLLALTLIPLFARAAWTRSRSSSPEGESPATEDVDLAADVVDAEHHGGRLQRTYARTLDTVLHRPWLAMAFVVIIAGAAVLLYPRLGTGFLPAMDEGGFVIDYLTPAGTALQDTDRLVKQIEKIVSSTPEVTAYTRRTGAELGLFATQQNKGDILVRLKPRGERERSADEIISDLREKIHEALPTLDVEFMQLLQDMLGDLEGWPNPIEIRIFGDDPQMLQDLADKVEPLLTGVSGVVDVVGVQRGNPEVEWRIDSTAAGRAGMTVEQVASQLSAAWLGDVPTALRLLDRSIPVRVRYPDRERLNPWHLATLTIRTPEGSLVPLQTLATPHASDGQSEWLRENLRTMAIVTARLEGRDLGSAVAEIRGRLANVSLPVGYGLEIGGQYESQRQAFRELFIVLAIACSLVFFILLIEFRALTPALLILATAPLSFGGAFALLLITGTELNVSSVMGLILLVGLVVKNGIVMLDYAHHLFARGLAWSDALSRAAQVRLRPILMTTLCTLCGLLPLALGLGAGAELQKPLALAVIGGLSLSMAVVLYALPAIYLALGAPRRSEV